MPPVTGVSAANHHAQRQLGEDVAAAARRRLREELGQTRDHLCHQTDVGEGLIENERVTSFGGDAGRAVLTLHSDPDQVAAARWASPAELRREAQANPAALAPRGGVWKQPRATRTDEQSEPYATLKTRG